MLESKADTAGDSTVKQPRMMASDKDATVSPATEARPRDEKTAFAVQLLWSVQPIDIAQIPQLAIFSAYTLYGAEGNRDGRRWYGVRLGFFTDAVSAKQVAHYVRSDFSTVSVVPVTVRERERAKLASARPDATPVSAAARDTRARSRRNQGSQARIRIHRGQAASAGGAARDRCGPCCRAQPPWRAGQAGQAAHRPPGQWPGQEQTHDTRGDAGDSRCRSIAGG